MRVACGLQSSDRAFALEDYVNPTLRVCARWGTLALLLGCGGANGEPDATTPTGDGGSDAGSVCMGEVDGTACGVGRVCNAGECAETRCGDRVVDMRSE